MRGYSCIATITFLTVACAWCQGQPVFNVEDLPRSIGDGYRVYVDTNEVDVAELIGPKGEAQIWDFSAPQRASEKVQRIEIVARNDGGRGAQFPDAEYAERTTHEPSEQKAWSYHRIDPTQGRFDYGFDDPVSNGANPVKVLDPATVDLPATIVFGQEWHREVEFMDKIDLGFAEVEVLIKYTSDAVVDGWGTVILPNIGEVAALRVNEGNSYEATETTLGLPLGTTHVRNYYWLVKGIGKAVQIISAGNTARVPENFMTARTYSRVFEADLPQTSPPTTAGAVSNLRIVVNDNKVNLSWDKAAAATRYEVKAAEQIGERTNWELLGNTGDTMWIGPVETSGVSRFYRVNVAQ